MTNLITAIQSWDILKTQLNSILLDVRTEEEFKEYEWPNLSSIKKEVLKIKWDFSSNLEFFSEQLLSKISSDKTILFLCKSGIRSYNSASYCAFRGFLNCYNIVDGFLGNNLGPGWVKSGLPVKKSI